MRKIPYSIRLAIVLTVVTVHYLGIIALLHQPIQFSMLAMLLATSIGTERLWAFLDWMNPVFGKVDTKEQERTQQRKIENELTVALRHNSPLVLAAIQEEKRTSLHLVQQQLRKSDSVFRSEAGYLMVLLPNTTLDQAKSAFRRLHTLPIKNLVMMNEQMIQEAAKTQHSIRGRIGAIRPEEIRKICIQAIEAKFHGQAPRTDEGNKLVLDMALKTNATKALPEADTVVEQQYA